MLEERKITIKSSKKGFLKVKTCKNWKSFQNSFICISGVLTFSCMCCVVVVEDFGSWVFGIFGEFSEFSENFRRKKTKKSLVLRISRYSILEVRYDILFDILKSPIYRHSIISRYDNLSPG